MPWVKHVYHRKQDRHRDAPNTRLQRPVRCAARR